MGLSAQEYFINEIDSSLSKFGGRSVLYPEIHKLIGIDENSFAAAWAVQTGIKKDGIEVEVIFVFDHSIPHCRPQVYAHPDSGIRQLDFPHVENRGRLCVWGDHAVVDTNNPSQYIEELYIDVVKLLKDITESDNTRDFEDEFLSYWFYHCSAGSRGLVLCDKNHLKTTSIWTSWSNKFGYIFSDTKDKMVRWLDRQRMCPSSRSKKKREGYIKKNVRKTALFVFDRPWTPDAFPSTAGQLIDLLGKEDGIELESAKLLLAKTLTNDSVAMPSLLCAFRSERGVCYAGIYFESNLFANRNKRRGKPLYAGFRSKIILKHVIERIQTLRIYGLRAYRSDYTWIAGRDKNPLAENFGQPHEVGVIGCGSVGAPCIELLAKSGVSKFVLYDPDMFLPENSSRHCLGQDSVFVNKALAIKKYLEQKYPHVQIEAFDAAWQKEVLNNEDAYKSLERCDVILSCTADWFSDKTLLDLQDRNVLGPIIFGLTEPNAMAGHVILNDYSEETFDNLHIQHGETVGNFKYPVTQWAGTTTVSLPACGGVFQPYGMTDLSNLHSLLSKQALSILQHGVTDDTPRWSVWFGDRKDIQGNGGDWNEHWISKFGNPGKGMKVGQFNFRNNEWYIIDD